MSALIYPKTLAEATALMGANVQNVVLTSALIIEIERRLLAVEAITARLAELAGGPR